MGGQCGHRRYQQPSFGDLDSFMQSLFVVTVEHRHRLLRQYWPGVRASVYQVHRSAGDLHPVGQRVSDTVLPGKAGSSAGWVLRVRP